MLAMILAMDNNMLIGDSTSKNGIPWDYPEDMQFYKKMTVNKKNIMGRITYDKIGFALPNRQTFVLTRDTELKINGVTVLNTVEEVLKLDDEQQEIMIIGGVQVFELLKDYVNIIYLTKIDTTATGDVYYKNFSTKNFKLVDSYQGENKDLTFEKWVKC